MKQPVALYYQELRGRINTVSLSTDSIESLQQALTAAGYPSVSIPNKDGGVDMHISDFHRAMNWCHARMGFNDFVRVGTRMYFMDDEHAILFKLTAL